MGQLIVRNVNDDLIRALKMRAAEKRRSAEAEHREILREALESRRRRHTLKQLLAEMPTKYSSPWRSVALPRTTTTPATWGSKPI